METTILKLYRSNITVAKPSICINHLQRSLLLSMVSLER